MFAIFAPNKFAISCKSAVSVSDFVLMPVVLQGLDKLIFVNFIADGNTNLSHKVIVVLFDEIIKNFVNNPFDGRLV